MQTIAVLALRIVTRLLDGRRKWRTCRHGRMFVSAIALALPILTSRGIATAAAADAVETPPDDGLLTLKLNVRLPDGSPAVGAIVQSHGDFETTTQVDKSGNVTVRGVFGNGAMIYARSVDGAFQATFRESASDARAAFTKRVELTLAPAVDHKVRVMAEGKPAADVQVVAAGHYFKAAGKTGPDGIAMLKLPADDRLIEVVAWHAQRGVAGVRDVGNEFAQDSTNLSLVAPAPLTIRIVDPHGEPVPEVDLRLSMHIKEGGGWIIAKDIDAAQMRANEDGEAVVAWAPGDGLEYVDVDIMDSRWKIDEIDRKQLSKRLVTIHARRQKPVQGRLIMPDGASAEGILVTGFGFGPLNRGAIPETRARRDGTFSFDCPSEHAFVLGVFDGEWTNQPWTGVILAHDDDQDPAEIAIHVRRAIPLTVRVTRERDHIPTAGAFIDLQQQGDVHWVDAQGEEQDATGRVGGWLRTDSKGIARGGVARGKVKVGVQSGKWFEYRTVEVKANDPIEIEFHRPWLADRKVIARMTLDGHPYEPSSNLVAKAWTERKGFTGPIHQATIREDNAVEVAFDEENLVLLVIDREKQRSGYTKLGPDADSAELAMRPTASYSGTLLDEQDRPLADRTLELRTEWSWLDVVEPQAMDHAGRFHFTGIAVNVPLRLTLKNEEGLTEHSLFDRGKVFEPGEMRSDDKLQVEPRTASTVAAPPPRPVAERLAKLCEDARVAGMHVLVLIEGDDTKNVIRLTDCLLDADNELILAYLPVSISASQLTAEAATLAERGWPRPASGESVLIALDGRQKLLGIQRITVADVDAAVMLGKEFLTRHRPPAVDARATLQSARATAAREERRVWIVSSGPRCGPCFRLARWMDEQHEVLEKDYVFVKAMLGLHRHADEVSDEIGAGNHGTPWHVITEPDGKILATSEGPLGNIGMPASIEGIRHLRAMLEQTSRRLSAKEIDDLIESLTPAQ